MADNIEFTFAYCGTALNDGSMDVKQLAPALLSMGELLELTNKELNEKRSTVSVKVKSDFKKGSFQVSLDINQLIDQGLTIISNYSPVQILELLGLLGLPTYGLIRFIKDVHGKIITKKEKNNQGEFVIEAKSTSGDVTTIIVKDSVFNLYNNPPIRKAVSDILNPLQFEGVEEFKTIQKGKTLEKINKKEFEYFKYEPAGIPILVDKVEDAIFNLVNVAFDKDNKWRLSDDRGTIYAVVKDEDFVNRIEKEYLRFGKYDILKVKLRTKQWVSPDNKIRTEHEIVLVLDHIKMPEQTVFSLDITKHPKLTDGNDDSKKE